MAGSGALVLAAGLATGDPMAVFFSWIGLVFGGAMIGFARYSGTLHRNWGLAWHLNAMTLLFNAVHGTLTFVLWRSFVDPGADTPEQLGFQVLTVVVALALRLHFGHRFRAPIAFGAADTLPGLGKTTKP